MSKSDSSDMTRINLIDTPEKIAEKIKRAKTDPDLLPDSVGALEGRPEAMNLIKIYAGLSGTSPEMVLSEFSGKGFGIFKPKLTDLCISVLDPIRVRMKELLEKDPIELDSLIRRGADKANAVSRPIVREAYDAIGFLTPD
jgi:tryptophanyl-tRNA synthetase